MKRILITGAGGFVGRHAVEGIAAGLEPGDRLAGIGRDRIEDLPEPVERHVVDLLDERALGRFVAAFRPTHTLHLAAAASVHQAASSPSQTWRVNVGALLNLADAICREASGSAFFFVSSAEVYGRAFLSGRAVSETDLPQPATAYARTKLAGEMLLGDILPAAKVKLIVLRPFNHVGPGQDERFVLPSFAGQIARIEAGLAPPVMEVGDLSATRDFLDVRDVVDAYIRLIAMSDALPGGSVFNICSGEPRRISAILDALRSAARVPCEIRVASDRLRPSEIPTACGSAHALAEAAGWQPRIPWSQTLGAVLDDARRRAGGEAG